MTTPLLWSCICGEHGKGETAAQRHAATCDLMGRPRTNPHAPAWRPPTEGVSS